MSKKYLVNVIVLAGLAVPCAAQVSEPLYHVVVPTEELRAASPQCSSGIVYDDGGFSDFYSIGSGNPGDSTMVMKFDLPPGTTKIDQVCACFARVSSSSPSSMSFEAVVYNDNGPGGQPGTFLGSVSATASSIPIVGSSQFYSVDLSGSGIVLPDTSVYVGVRWPGGSIFLCGDRSSSTTQRLNYGSGNSGGSWSNLSSLFPTVPPRAMGIRLDPATSSATCTPSAAALCLNNGRFRVSATFDTTGGQSGQAQVVKLTDETGYLWFFSATNVEVVVKVLNACTFNQRYWVYSAGLTDVHVVLTVTDTLTGAVKTYTNPQSRAFLPILDSSAFATCP
jgi:hypothetical protein